MHHHVKASFKLQDSISQLYLKIMLLLNNFLSLRKYFSPLHGRCICICKTDTFATTQANQPCKYFIGMWRYGIYSALSNYFKKNVYYLTEMSYSFFQLLKHSDKRIQNKPIHIHHFDRADVFQCHEFYHCWVRLASNLAYTSTLPQSCFIKVIQVISLEVLINFNSTV